MLIFDKVTDKNMLALLYGPRCSFCFFCLYMKYTRNIWRDLRQIHRENVFGPSPGRVWISRSKVKGQGQTSFSRLMITNILPRFYESQCTFLVVYDSREM